MTNRVTESTKTVAEPFELKLPKFLADVRPIEVIHLPGGHEGLIYEEVLTERAKSRNQGHYTPAADALPKETKGWRYMVRKADGSPAKENIGVGHWAGAFYDNALDLALAIQHDAQLLTPKTTTRKRRDDYAD